jgi:hydrogenase maturation protease
MKGKVLIVGIGNIFLGDDAFGVEVVKRLQLRDLPGNVVVRDFGIRSYDLAYALIEPWEQVILVDAVPRDGEPGTLYKIRIENEEISDAEVDADAHTMNPAAVLKLVRALGGNTGPLMVIGCEPANLEPDPNGSFGLSAPVAAAVDEAAAMVEELVTNSQTKSNAA